MNKQLQNNKPLLALLFALLMGGGTAWAQSQFTVCDGTATDERIPMTGFCSNMYGKHEFVYPQDLLTQIQGTGISSLRFYSTSTENSWGNAIFRVFMKTINTSTISDYQGYEDATIVYEGPLSVAEGVMDIQLTTPYYYSTGNLLIGVYQIGKGYSSSCWFYGQTVNGASIAGWNENSIENLNASNAQFPNFLPKTTFISREGDITASVSPEGSGAISGVGFYEGGTTCTLIASANDGYTFVNWEEHGIIVSTESSYSFVVGGHRTLVANFLQSGNISFADANVKALCVASATGWDTNGDGELSYAEAAAVTNIGTVFKGKTNIQSFNELQYFIFLTAIDEQAFRNCSNLAEITIPKNVTSIGSMAFMGCTALAEITIPERITSIGDKAFVNCPALATVHFNAINCTSMCTVYNEENYSVFMSNQTTFPLTNLTIGSNVQHIPDYAFRGCDHIQILDLSALEITVGQYAFYGCTNLATLTIGEGVTFIGGYAFWNCPALATVHFNAINCKQMHTRTGSGTSSNPYGYHSVFNSGTDYRLDPCPIVTLTIGENVTTIPDYAFRAEYNPSNTGEYGIESNITGNLIIPNSVTTIGRYAFSCCRGLSGNLIIPNSVSTIGQNAFHYCSGFTGSLVIPNSVTTIDYMAFFSCTGFTGSLTLPNSVTLIGYYAFSYCGFTGSLIIPNSVTTISNGAFYFCSGFTGDLNIPHSVTTIGQSAFFDCSGFTGNLIIPHSVAIIGENTFSGCTSFTGNLIIPNSVTTIEKGAFSGCTGFTGNLVIPNSVSTIGQSAFYNCSSFTALITEKSIVPSTNSSAFNGMNYTIPVYVPAGKVMEYQSAEGWSYFTNIKSQVNFLQDSNDQWSEDFNWSSWAVPSAEDVVCITDNCQLDTDANVLYVYIADNTKVLTVNSGKTLNTTYGIHIENPSQLVVEDGGQVKSDIPFSGTVQKHIDAYTNDDDGWNFIASPVTENQSISGLIPSGETVYDLYYLDEENTYWRNYKVNAFEINHNQGYLYGNQAGTTINFSGALQPYVEDGVSIPLTKEGEGWNLVGNPFTFNAYANKPYYVINGRNVEAAASGAIAPCTGIVVKAEGTTNETVKFTKDEPVTSSAPSNGSLQIVLDESNTRGASTGSATAIDNAIVSFNEGTTLPKFRFGDNAQIYFPQNGEDYAIACAAKTGELPLNFKATKNGEYTLSVNPEGVKMEYLHLIDNMTGADVDLLQTSDYTFNAKTTDYASRFRLVFSANSVDENGASTGSAAFAYINNGEIVITNATADATLQIVDVTGRVVVSVGGHTRCVPTTSMTPGVYVLRLINGNDVKTQKMVIR